MLLSFRVGNFCSFDQIEHFSMIAGRTRNFSNRTIHTGTKKILKFKAVYGANASGKSNLVKAINFMQYTVLRGLPSTSPLEYCRTNEVNINRTSFFEIEVTLDEVHYIYGFEVLLNEGRFIREWLNEQKGRKSKRIFTRNMENGFYDVTSYISNSALNERLRIYADDVKQDSSTLFLRIMNQNKDSLYGQDSPIKVYHMLYQWFQRKLSVNFPEEPITKYNYFFDSQGSAAEEILSELDTGISKVTVYDESIEKVKSQFPKGFWDEIQDELGEQKRNYEESEVSEAPAVMIRTREGHSMYIIELIDNEIRCKTLKFRHHNSFSLFSLDEESDGTIRLLDLLEVLLANSPNMVYVIDEISRCLHPLLTKRFIQKFLSLAIKRNIQLIVTTHESELLDLDLLRQDEIGFVGRYSQGGTSQIFGLEKFGTRFDKKIRKAYLEGEYGAIPNFDIS